ncbi:ACBD7 protein, partial [Pseudoatta argentina]
MNTNEGTREDIILGVNAIRTNRHEVSQIWRNMRSDSSLQWNFLSIDDDELSFYRVSRQSIALSKPGMLDFKGKAKWEAWNKKKGTSQEVAKQAYINYAKQLIEKYK